MYALQKTTSSEKSDWIKLYNQTKQTMAMQVDLELKKVSKIKYSLQGKKIDLTFTLPIYL